MCFEHLLQISLTKAVAKEAHLHFHFDFQARQDNILNENAKIDFATDK
jgi:hypothetical protein